MSVSPLGSMLKTAAAEERCPMSSLTVLSPSTSPAFSPH
jgi:hypothetical protein